MYLKQWYKGSNFSEILVFGGLPSGAVSRPAKLARLSGLADFVGYKWPYFVLVQAPNRPHRLTGGPI